MKSVEDTIVAPATAQAEAALSIVRISGSLCPALATDIFAVRADEIPPRTCKLGRYRTTHGKILDQVVYVLYPDNGSFTGEPLLEITCHGSPFIVRKILEDALQRGCRLAEPGEFSRRAFLNGKIDLSQAEGIADLIRARSDRALESARRQLEGSLGTVVNSLVSNLLNTTAHLEAYIDFPEEDLPPESEEGPAREIQNIIRQLDSLIATRPYSAMLHDGIRTVIAGLPNAGKSSLLNALTGEDRAIVSPEPGTTRDYVEETLYIGPYLLRVVDTAGLHDSGSDVEKQGISRSLQQIQKADFILVVLDQSQPPPALPDSLVQALQDGKCLIIDNKSDLPRHLSTNSFLPGFPHIRACTLSGEGIPELRQALKQELEKGVVIPDNDAVLVSARHAEALQTAKNHLSAAAEGLQKDIAAELIATELHLAIEAIGHITGKIDNERMLDQLFANFCIGK